MLKDQYVKGEYEGTGPKGEDLKKVEVYGEHYLIEPGKPIFELHISARKHCTLH